MTTPVERIQQILTVTEPDGTTRIVEGTTLVPSTDTPDFGVKERLVSVPGTGPRQTVTTFAPAMTRPRTYPGELPFVADATIYATEHPDGDQPPSARYLIERDPESVIEIVVRQSIDTGWNSHLQEATMRFAIRKRPSKDRPERISKIRCSFCGKSRDAVEKLISGPGVYICDECIALCNRILAEESSK
jgi:hypothetical protein